MIQDLHYLDDVVDELEKRWPDNRTVNIVCHGHSVPSGYFDTPVVDTFNAYPHLLHRLIKERFPYAVVNVIVTAIGGENAVSGAARFARDVLPLRPDVIVIDYSLNDRGVPGAGEAWEEMIRQAKDAGAKVILCTPTWDTTYHEQSDYWQELVRHAQQVRELADRYSVGLADNFAAFQRAVDESDSLNQLLSHWNHPSRAGHELAAGEIARYFPAR
ncbi:MAG: SGNH/GDSL hydrolase family protein [Clostridia bacterium]|nr:SGNH/GDSL hydrolase family protein [Clostridia bacterium]